MLNPFDYIKEPSKNDILNGWILRLFDNESVIGKAYGSINAAFATAGAFALLFFIILGIVSSAYTGKVLGERYHQIWAPLRVVLGFGLLIPIAGGFSSSHLLLRSIVRPITVNLGNAPWFVIAEEVLGNGKSIVPYRVGGMDLVFDIVEHELCAAIQNQVAEYANTARAPIPPAGGSEEGWGIFSDKSQVWDYGPGCGNLSFSLPSNKAEFSATRISLISQVITEIRDLMPEYAKFGFKYASEGRDFSKLAIESVGVGAHKLFEKLIELAKTVDDGIIAAAEKDSGPLFPESRKALVETSREEGLMKIGDFALSLSANSALTTKLTNERHENIGPDYSADSNSIALGMKNLVRKQLGLGAQYAKATANNIAAAGDSASGIVTQAFAPILRSIFEAITLGEAVDNAFAHVASTGQNLKAAGGWIIVIGGGVKVASGNALGKVVGADGAVDWFLSWAGWAAMISIILGVARADVFPMIPYIMVNILGIRVTLGFIKAMIGMTFWAWSLIRMDGQDFFEQKQIQGWNKLVELMVRPALHVLGFATSLLVFDNIYSHIHMSLATAYFGVVQGVLPDPVNLIVFYILETVLCWILIFNLFGHIGNIIDDILDWGGMGVKSETHGQEVLAAATAANAVSQKMPNPSGGMKMAGELLKRKFKTQPQGDKTSTGSQD